MHVEAVRPHITPTYLLKENQKEVPYSAELNKGISKENAPRDLFTVSYAKYQVPLFPTLVQPSYSTRYVPSRAVIHAVYFRPPLMASFRLILSMVLCNAVLISPFLKESIS